MNALPRVPTLSGSRGGPRRLALAAAIAVAAAPSVVVAQEPAQLGFPSPVARGYESLQRMRLDAADSMFRAAARSSQPQMRRAGLEAAALLAWRFLADTARAEALLDRALAEGADSAWTLASVARLRAARGEYRAAARAALAAADRDSVLERSNARRRALRIAVKAAVEPLLVERVDGGIVAAARRPSLDTLGLAVARLAAMVRASPGHTDDSYALLLGALAVDDGLTALDAVRSYFLVGIDERSGRLVDAQRELGLVLPTWDGARATPAARARVIRALGASGLYVAAALVARGRGAPPPTGHAAEVVAYAAFCRALQRAVDDFYRRTLLGRAQPTELSRIYVRLTRALWPRLAWPGAAPRYFPAGADSELSRRFGAVIHFGRSAGYFDLHYGHRVLEERRDIAQYGHRAAIHFVAVDGVVSDGLQSWVWEERGAHAGWQSGQMIFQVRPALTENPLAFWELLTDSATARATATQLAADSAADWERVATREVAYLPGVELRILRDGARALFDSLRATGLAGDSLRWAFVSTMARDIRDASVFGHEGRHVIDESLGITDPAELEFRAKLSEIAFAPRPRLVLGGIMHVSVGDATPHGQANARVLRGVVAWIRAHRAGIAGLDTTRALLPQLPLLSDAQLRAAFRSLDPLAAGR